MHTRGRMRRDAGLLLLFGLLTAGAVVRAEEPAPAAPAPEAMVPAGAVPFPVDKTQTLRGEGSVFVIDGLVVIPPQVEIGVEWGAKLLGVNGGRLEVQGGLKVRGTEGKWVEIQNVDFSPTLQPERGVHLDMVNFLACRFVHAEGAAFEGDLMIENSTFQTGSEFAVRIRKGKLSLFLTAWRPPCAIQLVPTEGEPPDIGVAVRSSEFRAALRISGAGDVGLSHNALKEGVVFTGVSALTVDGCDIHTGLEIHQAAADTFKDVNLTKCNIFNGVPVTLDRVAAEGQKTDLVFLQKFYFGTFDGSEPTLDPKAIEALVKLGPGNVKVKLDKPRKSKHLLVPYDALMKRPPPLHR